MLVCLLLLMPESAAAATLSAPLPDLVGAVDFTLATGKEASFDFGQGLSSIQNVRIEAEAQVFAHEVDVCGTVSSVIPTASFSRRPLLGIRPRCRGPQRPRHDPPARPEALSDSRRAPCARRVASLRTDDRGVGGSTGSYFETTLSELAADALAGVAFLRSRHGIDPAKVGVIGCSQGALLAAIAATRSDS